ncbi:hypothetical protein [Thaumasiovibrio subtropicus]|uniref:hypothetical protein n=1 Tax=Thaumasiovibrio subtropicus TaxID=1891207 RepID=UPI00131CDBF2|nr:hypothetical protein [Thaumasiovibrio subtropicus]
MSRFYKLVRCARYMLHRLDFLGDGLPEHEKIYGKDHVVVLGDKTTKVHEPPVSRILLEGYELATKLPSYEGECFFIFTNRRSSMRFEEKKHFLYSKIDKQP